MKVKGEEGKGGAHVTRQRKIKFCSQTSRECRARGRLQLNTTRLISDQMASRIKFKV